MSLVGIIANPASGQDIRRVVSDAIIVNNHQKVNVVRRLVAGLTFGGVQEIQIMPDLFGIGERALQDLSSPAQDRSRISIIDMPYDGTQADSLYAAEYLRTRGADCILVLGGDGTTRVVAKECGEVPLLPISTGTNNVLPSFVEGTIAGLAAATIAQHPELERPQVADRHKCLIVSADGKELDRALVDIALVRSAHVGARAVWEGDSIAQVLVTRAQPTAIGLSAVIGMVKPVNASAPFGAVATLGTPGEKICVPIAPGVFVPLEIQSLDDLAPNVPFKLSTHRPAVLALDGEREVVLPAGVTIEVTLKLEGPWIVNIDRVMRFAVQQRFFLV